MMLRYLITSYASRYVDLTGGLLSCFEDFIIGKISNWTKEYKDKSTLKIMSDRELADLGMMRSDIALISKGRFAGGHEQRLK